MRFEQIFHMSIKIKIFNKSPTERSSTTAAEPPFCSRSRS